MDIREIYGEDITTWGPLDIVNICRDEASELGYVEYSTFFHDHVTADCARVRALEQPFRAVWRRWEEFAEVEPALAERLKDECRHGLPSRDHS
jgi:hypothetical protein